MIYVTFTLNILSWLKRYERAGSIELMQSKQPKAKPMLSGGNIMKYILKSLPDCTFIRSAISRFMQWIPNAHRKCKTKLRTHKVHSVYVKRLNSSGKPHNFKAKQFSLDLFELCYWYFAESCFFFCFSLHVFVCVSART